MAQENNNTQPVEKNVQPQEQTPTRRAKKIVVLDHFGKRILNVVLAVMILSVFATVIIFSFAQPTKLVDVSLDKAVAYYDANIVAKVDTLTITYKEFDTTRITDIVFDKGLISKKVTTERTATTATVIVVRKLSVQDKDFIKTNIAGMADATDAAIADYVKTSTDYIKITNTLLDGKWEVTSQALSTKTYLEVGGTVYKDYLEALGFTGSIATAKAMADYNIFGLGYGYTDYQLTDDQGNVLSFKDNYFSKLTIKSSGAEFDFDINTPSYAKLGIKNI